MMTSLFFAILGYALLAVVSILDKSILDNSVKKPAVYTFYSTIFFFLAFFALPWCEPISGLGFWMSVFSGLAYGFGMWTMFTALEFGEASHVTPFVGAVVALSTFFLSASILGETLGLGVKVGLFFLILASILLSVERNKNHTGFHKGFIWAFVSGILFGFSHVSAKFVYGLYPFFTGIIWTKGTVGLVALIALFVPGVLNAVFNKGKDKIKIGGGKIVFWNKTLGILAVVLVQYAIFIGSVTVVNGLAGIHYALMFIFIYLLTKFKPRTFSEKFTKKELVVESVAILFMIIGLLFIQ
ncbi:MAG: DMT family transporter [bacterium]